MTQTPEEEPCTSSPEDPDEPAPPPAAVQEVVVDKCAESTATDVDETTEQDTRQDPIPAPSFSPQIPPAPEDLPNFLSGIVASATSVGHEGRQEDACFHLQLPGCNVIAVADGIGSFSQSRIGSHQVVSSAVGSILRFVMDGGLKDIENHPELPELIVREAVTQADRDIQRLNLSLAQSGNGITATTLLLVAEFSDCFVFGSIGDGGAFHFSGDGRYARNYLPKGGKYGDRMDNALGTAANIKPDIQKIPKLHESGNFFAICSDGMAVGFVNRQRRQVEKQREENGIYMIRDEMAYHFANKQTPNADVHHILERWVRGYELEVEGGSNTTHKHDNRTVGVLIDEDCLEYWMKHGTAFFP